MYSLISMLVYAWFPCIAYMYALTLLYWQLCAESSNRSLLLIYMITLHTHAKRAKRRDSVKEQLELRLKSPTESPSTSRSVTSTVQISISATESGCSTPTTVPAAQPPSDTEVLVNTALLGRVEALEAENSRLNRDLDNCEKKRQYFRLEQVKHDDELIHFYTGFVSYAVFLSFFNFLGPVVNELRYRGEKGGQG